MSDKWNWLAFISYKHDDIEMARWLQEKLERYKLPSYLSEDYPNIRKSLQPIFRDETDLGLGYLDENIKANLQASQYLIVICSRTTPQSSYVCDEIEEFIRQGKKKNILPILLEGTPEECFPAPLLKGKVPLGANINEISREYAMVKVIAALLGGIAIDKLWQRHLKAEEEEKEQLIAEKRRLQMIQSRFLSEKASVLIEKGDIYTARMVLLEALPVKTDDPDDRPLIKEAVELLRSAIDKEGSGSTLLLHSFRNSICDLDVSHNGRYAGVGLYSDISSYGIPVIKIIDLTTGQSFTVGKSDNGFWHGIDAVRFSSDDRFMFSYGFDSSFLVWDSLGRKSKTYNIEQCIKEITSAAWLGKGHRIALAGKNAENVDNMRIAVFNTDDSSCKTFGFNHKAEIKRIECSEDGKYIAFNTTDKQLCVLDVSAGTLTAKLTGPCIIDSFRFNPTDSNDIVGTFAQEKILMRLNVESRTTEIISTEHHKPEAYAFSPDGLFLAYIEGDSLKIADVQAKTATPFRIPDKAELSSVIYSRDGRYIICSASDGVFCFNTKNHASWKILSNAKNKIIKFCGDTYRLIIGSSSNGKGELQSIDFSYLLDHTNYDIRYAAIAHNGKLMTYLNKENAIYIADTKTHLVNLIEKLDSSPCFKARPILFSESDRYLASMLIDGSLFVHDLQTGASFRSKKIKEEKLLNSINLGFLPEETLMVFIDNENAIAAIVDEYVCVWHYHENRYNIRKLDFKPENLAYNSLNNILVMVGGYEKGICCKWFLTEDRIAAEELTNARASGKFIIFEGKETYSIYNVETERIKHINVKWSARSIAVSPDGRYAALESPYSLNIVIVDMEIGKTWSLERYSDSDVTPFVRISFEDSGHVLVSSCDTNITRWFLDTGDKIVYTKAEHVFGNDHGAVVIERGTLKIKRNSSVQEMIDQTRERFKEREFTDSERMEFYLDL